jgi:hypothetical protein
VAEQLTVPIHVGGGAMMFIENTKADPRIEWLLRYSRDLNDPQAGRFSAAAVVESYTYLLSRNISTAEAIRRLRLLRTAAHAHGFGVVMPSEADRG